MNIKKLKKLQQQLSDEEMDYLVKSWIKNKTLSRMVTTKKEDVLFVRLCNFMVTNPNEILAKNKNEEISIKRHKIAYTLHQVLKINCLLTGRVLKRNHATILNSCRVINGLLSYDKQLQKEVGLLRNYALKELNDITIN